MKTTHTSLPFVGHTLRFVELDPVSSHEQDLLWLPHYAQLQHAGRKCKTERLAGRIIVTCALRECDHKCAPTVGEPCQPVQPVGVYGSIDHCGTMTSAVISHRLIGIDTEETFSIQTTRELTDDIITPAGHERLTDCGLVFPLALTLALSIKESAFRTNGIQVAQDFLDYQIISQNKRQVIIRLEDEQLTMHQQIKEKIVITLCQHD